MSVDKEMIEEMAKILVDCDFAEIKCWACFKCKQCKYNGKKHCVKFLLAEELLKHYQPKLLEDSVVQPTVQSYSTHDNDLVMLSRKEYEKLNMKYISALEQLETKGKEMAEKILNDVYHAMAVTYVGRVMTWGKFCDIAEKYSFEIPQETFTVKQLGVEIKE